MGGRYDDAVLLTGRLLLAAALLPAGIQHALNPSGFALALAGTGMPYPNGVATGSVVVTTFGPLALALGLLPRLTGLALAAHSVAMGLLLHRFWQYGGATARIEQELFLAQAGLAGGLVLYAMIGPGAWGWQGWWHGRRGEPAPAPAAPRKRPPAARPAKAPPRPARVAA
ncbi:DoxX family membrane protein [uncultured Methylobacterium sp.]|uniref:DoxX family membrane protein n=1 Tax=uncultured Methylobacterium sp. TaxID=157278 RepID=UPI002621B998|nr:DoxX family membrane protein [uncultured Methylobacterium sp.]